MQDVYVQEIRKKLLLHQTGVDWNYSQLVKTEQLLQKVHPLVDLMSCLVNCFWKCGVGFWYFFGFCESFFWRFVRCSGHGRRARGGQLLLVLDVAGHEVAEEWSWQLGLLVQRQIDHISNRIGGQFHETVFICSVSNPATWLMRSTSSTLTTFDCDAKVVTLSLADCVLGQAALVALPVVLGGIGWEAGRLSAALSHVEGAALSQVLLGLLATAPDIHVIFWLNSRFHVSWAWIRADRLPRAFSESKS